MQPWVTRLSSGVGEARRSGRFSSGTPVAVGWIETAES